ncbi:MAG: histidine kinase dimerization/phospho-acceptor domain-containing protein, partial [Betaproteobacteria bacterium]
MSIDRSGQVGDDRRGQPLTSATRAPLPAAEAETADRRRLEQRKDMFLAMLGHELRNPLAGISSAVQLLAHPAVTQEQSFQAAKIVERQVSHMVHLVN